MTTVLASDAGDNEHLDEEMEQIVTDIKGHCNGSKLCLCTVYYESD